MMPIRTILCPIDFSDYSRKAFHLACSLASLHQAKLILAHVVDVLYGKQSYGGIPVEVRPANYPDLQLQKLKELHSPYPEVPVDCVVLEGNAVEQILHLASAQKCDLIVLSTRGWTGLRHLLLGSVAEQILRQAPCPVITVRSNLDQNPPATDSTEGRTP